MFDEPLAVELQERDANEVWVCKQALWPELQRRILVGHGRRAVALGAPFQGRVIFRVEPSASADRDLR